jgi:type I restriction enzyme S subunit
MTDSSRMDSSFRLPPSSLRPGWQIVRFDEIARNISKRVEPSETDLDVYVGLEHLDPQSLRITRRGVPSDVEGQKLRVRPGQIIFGKRRAYQKKLAVADFDGICSAHAMVLEEIPGKIIPGLLPYFMQSDMFMDRAVAISEGSLSPTIKWKALAMQEFPLPPPDRQKAILEVLQKVEECLQLCEATSGLANNVKALALSKLFNKMTGNEENILKGEALYKIGGGNAPADFILKETGDTIYVKVDCFNDLRNQTKIQFSEWMFDRKEAKQMVKIFPKGSVIFPKRGAAIFKNRVGILGVDAAVDSNIMVLQCNGRIHEEYLKQYLLWKKLSDISDNSGIPQLNNKHLYPLQIPVPSITEQVAILTAASEFDALQGGLVKRRDLYMALKQRILSTALGCGDI